MSVALGAGILMPRDEDAATLLINPFHRSIFFLNAAPAKNQIFRWIIKTRDPHRVTPLTSAFNGGFACLCFFYVTIDIAIDNPDFRNKKTLR